MQGRNHNPIDDYTMRTQQARLLVDCRNQLGEGIQWNPDDQRLYWTDIYGRRFLSCDENGADVRDTSLDASLCCFAFCDAPRMLSAFADGLYWFDPRTQRRELIEYYQPERPHTRMNDGALDRQGRLVVGGMDEEKNAPITPVWSVAKGAIHKIADNVGIANSIAFSPQGEVMYFTDTVGDGIYRYDYDGATGQISNRQLFTPNSATPGSPDGSCVDHQGGVWNARFAGGCVQRFLPNGTPDLRVALPVPNVTCCALGGRNLDRLFITTAQIGMTKSELADAPTAGGLFYADVPVHGVRQGKYLA